MLDLGDLGSSSMKRILAKNDRHAHRQPKDKNVIDSQVFSRNSASPKGPRRSGESLDSIPKALFQIVRNPDDLTRDTLVGRFSSSAIIYSPANNRHRPVLNGNRPSPSCENELSHIADSRQRTESDHIAGAEHSRTRTRSRVNDATAPGKCARG